MKGRNRAKCLSIVILAALVPCKAAPPTIAPAWQAELKAELARDVTQWWTKVGDAIDGPWATVFVSVRLDEIFKTVPKAELIPFLKQIAQDRKDAQSRAVSDFVRLECLDALQNGIYRGHWQWKTTDKTGKVIATEDLAAYGVPLYPAPQNQEPVKPVSSDPQRHQ